MFFNQKPSRERQREFHLTVMQLEKMTQKALENADGALVAFDKSYEHLFGKSDELEKTTLYLDAVMSVYRFLNQNEEILKQIKSLMDKNYLRTPLVIKESLRSIQDKNQHVLVVLRVRQDVYREERLSEKPEISLAQMFVLKKDMQTDLLQLRDSVKDFQELIRKQFLINSSDYVHESRLEELRNVEVGEFDLAKLIRLCEELNSAYQNENHLSVIVLVRAILDHVPPIFGHKYFIDVASQYGGKSLKKSLQNLQNSSRNIADAYLHEPIRSKESLPNETQVDFRNDLDVLLGEIVRILK